MLSIVIPCYNEQDNLEYLFRTLDPVAAQNMPLEIILVNNGSTDNSQKVLEQQIAQRNTDAFRIEIVEKNLGYGFGILSGLRAAKGDILAVTHADRQTDPMDVIKAYNIFTAQNNAMCLVKGRRVKRRLGEWFFSTGMGWFATIVLRKYLMDINAQPKLFSKAFFEKVEAKAPNDFALDTYFLYMAQKLGKVKEFPVIFAKRVAGEAKGGSGASWAVRKKLVKRCFGYIIELNKQVKNGEF